MVSENTFTGTLPPLVAPLFLKHSRDECSITAIAKILKRQSLKNAMTHLVDFVKNKIK